VPLFRSEADKERFTREAETWVSLGLHPHVCGCHYVRTIDGVPRVFAEYPEGGSLREWIDDRQLYRGAPTEALARILDLIAPVQQEVELLAPSGEVLLDLPTGLVESSGRAQDARADRRSAVGPPVLRCGG
jgi:hypothetical protein